MLYFMQAKKYQICKTLSFLIDCNSSEKVESFVLWVEG